MDRRFLANLIHDLCLYVRGRGEGDVHVECIEGNDAVDVLSDAEE